jgi:hypothetical protein
MRGGRVSMRNSFGKKINFYFLFEIEKKSLEILIENFFFLRIEISKI